MKFEQAMVYYRKGKRIKRKNWKESHYLCIAEYNAYPINEDLLADDWEVIYPPEVPRSFTRSEIIRAYSDALAEKSNGLYMALAGPTKLYEFDINLFLKNLGFEEENA